MKALQLLLCAIFAALLVVAGAPAASARANDDDDDCRRINAVGVGQDLGGGMTIATITRGGILNGTTAAQFVIGGMPPVFTFTGTITFTAKKGTLTVSIAGTFSVGTGAFAGSGPVTSGTGAFAGATGTLNFAGVENLVTGAFTETVKGRICLADGDDDD